MKLPYAMLHPVHCDWDPYFIEIYEFQFKRVTNTVHRAIITNLGHARNYPDDNNELLMY